MSCFRMNSTLTNNADNILITEGGVENLTPTPKEIDEIIKLVKSG